MAGFRGRRGGRISPPLGVVVKKLGQSRNSVVGRKLTDGEVYGVIPFREARG